MANIFEACKKNKVKNVEKYISKGGDVNAIGKNKFTLLHFAVFNNSVECAKLLLEGGAETNRKESCGWTPLQVAAYRQCIDCVKLLIDYDADYNIIDKRGLSISELLMEENKNIIKNYIDLHERSVKRVN